MTTKIGLICFWWKESKVGCKLRGRVGVAAMVLVFASYQKLLVVWTWNFIAIFKFCLVRIKIAQKVANWQLWSKFVIFRLVKFELLTEMLPICDSKVVIWQLFEQFKFWPDKSKNLLFNIIWKYLIRCVKSSFCFFVFLTLTSLKRHWMKRYWYVFFFILTERGGPSQCTGINIIRIGGYLWLSNGLASSLFMHAHGLFYTLHIVWF